MCMHYLGKFEVSDWAVNAIIKYMFEWLTEWQQTKSWLAVIVSQKKSDVSHHIIFITVCAQNVRLQHERKCVDVVPLSNSTFNNHVTQSGPLAVDVSFQFVIVRDLGTIDLLLINVKEVTDFQWLSGLAMFLWAGMRYPAWIHCCKRPKYHFCISQGSVATVLRLGGQNYCRLCHVSLRCCMPKIIKFGLCFTELFTK